MAKGLWVRSLVGELRSYKLRQHGQEKKKVKKFNKKRRLAGGL